MEHDAKIRESVRSQANKKLTLDLFSSVEYGRQILVCLPVGKGTLAGDYCMIWKLSTRFRCSLFLDPRH